VSAALPALPPAASPYPAGHTALAYADGASRGNPGPAAFGCVYALDDGTVLCGEGEFIGPATNNVAEYRGALACLQRLLHWDVRRAIVRLDSQLVVRQMLGEYRVKNTQLAVLYAQAQKLVGQFEAVDFQHVPRAENALADRLANHALDRAAEVR
jgi:ribonuclease HI